MYKICDCVLFTKKKKKICDCVSVGAEAKGEVNLIKYRKNPNGTKPQMLQSLCDCEFLALCFFSVKIIVIVPKKNNCVIPSLTYKILKSFIHLDPSFENDTPLIIKFSGRCPGVHLRGNLYSLSLAFWCDVDENGFFLISSPLH